MVSGRAKMDLLALAAQNQWRSDSEAARDYVGSPPRRGLLLESIVADHLARFAFAQSSASLFDAYERVLFWRSRKGWEVDFVLRLDGKPKALQVTLTRPAPGKRAPFVRSAVGSS